METAFSPLRFATSQAWTTTFVVTPPDWLKPLVKITSRHNFLTSSFPLTGNVVIFDGAGHNCSAIIPFAWSKSLHVTIF